jgi:arabinofuranosyltransferase
MSGKSPFTWYFVLGTSCLVLGVAISVLLNLFVPQPLFKDDMPGGPYRYEGMFDPPGNSYGYFDEEKAPTGESYRWTTAHAYTTFPYAANSGRYVDVSIRMAAFQASAQDPISVEVRLNGQSFSHLMVAGGFHVYSMRLDTKQMPNPYLDPAHVQIDLLAATRSTAQDPRQLGVAVDWITVQPVKGFGEIVVEAAVWAFFLLLVAAVATARLGPRWGLLFAGLALLSFVLLHLTYMPRTIGVEVEIGLAGVAWLLAALLAPRRVPAVGLVIAGFLLWVVVAGRALGDWQMDDAFISYRYASNLVHGYGLVYNPGEPVEGYTNFLWTLMSAAAIQLGWNPQSVAQAANILVNQCLIALAYVASGLIVGVRGQGSGVSRPTTEDGSYLTPDPRPLTPLLWPLLVAALLAVDVSLLFYGAKGSGMESASFALTVLLAIVFLWGWPDARGRAQVSLRIGAGVALALGALLRPEGLFVVAPVLLLVRAWQDRRVGSGQWAVGSDQTSVDERNEGRRTETYRRSSFVLRRSLVAAVPFLVVIVPYELWRISFYGYPFPNTFYAKTGLTLALLERGLVYVAAFAAPHWLIAVSAFLGAIGWAIARLRARRKQPAGGTPRLDIDGMLIALFLLTAIYTLYIVWVGGDHFPAMRFFVPLLAPMVLLAQEAFRGGLRLLRNNIRLLYAAAGALGLAVLVYAGISLWLQTDAGSLGQRANRETTAWERWGSAALWLRDSTPPNTVLAAFAAGAMADFSDRYTIDMLGLNDVHIAHVQVPNMGSEVAGHEKQDPAYVLARRPDYILATWQDYFSPIAGQLTAEYGFETVDAPTGTPVKWLRRNDTKGP